MSRWAGVWCGLVALCGTAWASAPQVLRTQGFVVTITERCQEGVVGCDDVLYRGVNRSNGQALTLHGRALMHDCPGTDTPCHHIGWRFDNHGTTYTVTDDGVLEVTRGDKLLLRQAGQWQAAAAAPASGSAKTPAGGAAMYCVIDQAPPQPCSMHDEVDDQLAHSMRFTIGQRTIHFSGKAQTGWWSGTLDGKPAMGYELNRGHIVYSTTDLGTRFEWWYRGMQHGNY